MTSSVQQPASRLVRAELHVTGALTGIFALRMFGLFMILPVFAVIGAQMPGATPLLVGMAIGAYGLMQALLQIPFGALSDRFGRRRLLLIGLLLFVAGSIVAALADTIHGVILGRALQGAGAIAGVIMALVADVVSEQHRTRAMAAIGMSIGAAFLLALISAPPLAAWLGISGLFWLNAALAGLAFLIALLVLPDVRLPSVRIGLSGRERFRRIFADGQLMRLNLGILILHMVLTAIFVVVPVLLVERFELALASHGLLYLLVLLLSVLAMVPLILLSERRGVRPVMRLALVLLAVALLGLAWMGDARWQMIGALWLFFTAFNLLEALLPSTVGRVAPAGTRGTALGVYSTFQFAGVFFGGVVGGGLLAWQGANAVFVGCAAMVLVWLVLATGMREPRRLDSRVLALDEGVDEEDWQARLLNVSGVHEAVVLPEQRVALLKVEAGRLDEASLSVLAGTGARAD